MTDHHCRGVNVDSRKVPGTVYRRRRYRCSDPDCPERWTTYEVPALEFKVMREMRKFISSALRVLNGGLHE